MMENSKNFKYFCPIRYRKYPVQKFGLQFDTQVLYNEYKANGATCFVENVNLTQKT